MLKRRLFHDWKHNNDIAITLYYMYLLHLSYADTPADELPDFNEDLETLTTLAGDSLPQIIRYFENINALRDMRRAHLTPEAINIVEDLFRLTFGTCEPTELQYNGLKLQKGNETYRVKNWMEKASKEVFELFSSIIGMEKIEALDLDTRKSKRITMLDGGEKRRILSFMFMSTSSMSKPFEIFDLVLHENQILKWRNESHISVVASISYQPQVASEIREKGMHSTGPLNFEALVHYFRNRIIVPQNEVNSLERDDIREKNIEIRSQQYDIMLDAIKSDIGGVIPWYKIISEIEAELQEYYVSLDLPSYWKNVDWI